MQQAPGGGLHLQLTANAYKHPYNVASDCYWLCCIFKCIILTHYVWAVYIGLRVLCYATFIDFYSTFIIAPHINLYCRCVLSFLFNKLIWWWWWWDWKINHFLWSKLQR